VREIKSEAFKRRATAESQLSKRGTPIPIHAAPSLSNGRTHFYPNTTPHSGGVAASGGKVHRRP
jgi:hypothetical protein